jgi:pheromone shutdown protein TraB
VSIVGAGHVPGIKAELNSDIDISALEKQPPRSPLTRIVGWSIPVLAIGMLAYGFFAGGKEMSFEMMKAWALVNGFAAAVGAALALAHPLSVISSFIAAPSTALNPFMASGWISGLVEALLRKPRVLDLENVLDDINSFKGIFRNRLTHILLVVALTNLTGTVGAILGIQQVAAMLYEL